jgi:hypothetical protein
VSDCCLTPTHVVLNDDDNIKISNMIGQVITYVNCQLKT